MSGATGSVHAAYALTRELGDCAATSPSDALKQQSLPLMGKSGGVEVGRDGSAELGRGEAKLRLYDEPAQRGGDLRFGSRRRQVSPTPRASTRIALSFWSRPHRHDKQRQAMDQRAADRAVTTVGHDQRHFLHHSVVWSAMEQGHVAGRTQGRSVERGTDCHDRIHLHLAQRVHNPLQGVGLILEGRAERHQCAGPGTLCRPRAHQPGGSSNGPMYRTFFGRPSGGKSNARLIAGSTRAGRSYRSITCSKGASPWPARAEFSIGNHSFMKFAQRLVAAATSAHSSGVRGGSKPLPTGGTPGRGRTLM